MEKVTKEQIAAWKKEHGDIIILNDPLTGLQIVLKKPERKVLKAAFSQSQNDPLALAEVILENCWIHGPEELKKEEGFLLSVNAQIDHITNMRMLEVEKP